MHEASQPSFIGTLSGSDTFRSVSSEDAIASNPSTNVPAYWTWSARGLLIRSCNGALIAICLLVRLLTRRVWLSAWRKRRRRGPATSTFGALTTQPGEQKSRRAGLDPKQFGTIEVSHRAIAGPDGRW